MDKDYSLRLLSSKSNGNSLLKQLFILLAVFGLIGLFFKKAYSSADKRNIHGTYCNVPLKNRPKNLVKNFSTRKIPRIVLPLSEINQSLKFAEKLNFDCFNIKKDSANKNEYNFKSTLTETSKILNDKSSYVMLKHTNPISELKKQSSELSIPLVDEVNNLSSDDNKAPEIISVLKINDTTGFYLTNYKDTLALFGYINNNVFLFEKFRDLSQINLQARYYDKSGDNDIYIVRLDNYKAMVEISNSAMRELARL